jgi:excisionase family DNA binding protein
VDGRLEALGANAELRREVDEIVADIRAEARDWQADREEAKRRRSADGTNQVPTLVEVSLSTAMEMSTINAAGELGVSTSYVTRLARRGDLPARKSGRDWLFDETAVRAYGRRGEEARAA